jgi:hypothetical protein
VDIANDCYGKDAVRGINQDLVGSCNSKDYSIRKFYQSRDLLAFFVKLRCFLVVEIGAEFDAGCIGFKTWKHEGRLAQAIFQKTIYGVAVITFLLLVLILEVVEASCRGKQEVSIRGPSKSPYE